jgi:hypothetical protein
MSSQKATDLTVDKALKILKKYSCSENKTVNSEAEKEQLRQALLLIISLSEWENIGICASNEREGFTALKSYLQAFGYDNDFKIEEEVNIQGEHVNFVRTDELVKNGNINENKGRNTS